MRALFLLNASDSADQYITQESIKLLSIFSVAGGWIIAALILAPVFWKAGEERWKAYIPIYKWMIVFKLASLNPALGLLGLIPWILGLVGMGLGTGTSAVLLWFQFFAALAGPIPVILTFIGAIFSNLSGGLLALAVLTPLVAFIFQIFYGVAVYRIGVHLQHSGKGWLVLSIALPVVALIVFAVDRSVWQEDSEIGWDSGKIGAVVPPARW